MPVLAALLPLIVRGAMALRGSDGAPGESPWPRSIAAGLHRLAEALERRERDGSG